MELNRGKLFLSSMIIFMFFLSSLSMASTHAMTTNTSPEETRKEPVSNDIGVDEYAPINEVPLNVKEEMTLSPMFTPDNALAIHAAWLRQAQNTIEVQNQYIKQFDRDLSWVDDPNPVVRELVNAADRGVSVRVQVREDSDSDLVGPYLDGITNIEVRYMGSSTSSTDQNWLSATHNKLVIIDDSVTLISSINFGDNAFLNNREAGMVVQSASVANYFLDFFEEDWADGETNVQLASPNLATEAVSPVTSQSVGIDQGESFTDIPRTNFTGTYNVSAYVNPDNADEHIFKYLASAEESIYVSMYTISKEEFVDQLVELKQNNPAIDIQVLISRRRVGGSENVDTQAAALRLTENLIPVYNSTSELNFYHNKYWIIDGKHTFVYSGNWSPRSVTTPEDDGDWSSGDPNRDMGIAVHDAPDIANFFKSEVWDLDVAAGVAYDLPVGISQNSFEQSEVASGTIDLSGTVNALTDPTVSYSFGSLSESDVQLTGDSFSTSIDTRDLDNGITTFEVTAIDASGATYSDSVDVNIVNYPSNDNFRLLITEVHANPDVVSDSEGEFFEITNSFPFALLVEDWQVGDDNNLYTFESGYQIGAYSSIIIARDSAGFSDGFNRDANIELSFSLTNSDDYVQILDQGGNYVDVLAYGSATAPDGSETFTTAFDPGLSIARSPLHVDTDSASDFQVEQPSPKAAVPEVALGEESDPVGLPISFVGLLLLFVFPILRRRRS